MTSNKLDYINYRIERSKELFQDAKILSENKRWRSCVNRLYYSSFHIVNALLFIEGITPKSHDGLKSKFLQLFIKTEVIDREYGKLYSKLIDWQQESDYSVFVDFQPEDVLPLIEEVKDFNFIIEKLIKEKSI